MEEEQELAAFQLLLKSEEGEDTSEYWQRQCCMLYNTINRNITDGSIEPDTCECAEGERSGLVTIYSVLSAIGLSLKNVVNVVDIVKLWLENRPKAKVLMKFPNGNEIEITGVTDLSKTDILDLFEKSLQMTKA
jgi:hypothetical protein